MVKKCRAISVMEMDVRTIPQASSTTSSRLPKKRKLSNLQEFEFSTTFVDVRSPEISVSDYTSTFCCSSNASAEFLDERFKEENDEGVGFCTGRERRETTPSSKFRSAQSEDMESTAEKNEASSGHGSLSEKMPTESELEEFFMAAEKDIQKRFAEKYNYDIVEDVPLEGRYEWVKLKP